MSTLRETITTDAIEFLGGAHKDDAPQFASNIIAAFGTALLNPDVAEAVERELPLLCDGDGIEVFYPLLIQKVLTAALAAVTGTEGGQGE